jgi:hypothetical protein
LRNKLICRSFIALLFLSVAGCGGKSSNESNNSANSANSANSPSQANNTPAQSAPAPAPAPPPVVIPAGSLLAVTLDQTVNSKTANNGDNFAASLAESVTINGSVVLPAGTKVSGTVVQAQSAGRFNGHALLQLTLDSIKLNGTPYSIQTSEFEDVGKGRGKRTAIGAGGGAAFGLIVGALAGGGKGAAIGALAGGGAGTAGAGFTGKKDIVLPAETRLHFKLLQPVSIAVSQ